MPREVVVLDVRRPGGRRLRQPPRSLPAIAIDLKVHAERAVYVRGRGLDAELGGDLRVSGTSVAPVVAGAFDMRRGTLALAGASLKFSRGQVTFNGTSARSILDPTLDFAADSNSNDVSATLVIGGYASAPTVTLTSTPELPQDEILAHLLFGVSAKQIAPLQMVSIGVALASISGVTTSVGDPMAAMQRRLGLDRLAVGGGTGADANSAVLEAGRYVSNRVYVGATQSTTGITKFQAQIDLTHRLKLQTVVGNGSATAQGTTPLNDPGNTLTLLYQIEY
jgi:translocation and assembly module TamB